MKRIPILLFLTLLCRIDPVWGVEAFESDANVIISHPKHSSVMTLPEELAGASTYRIVIYPNRNHEPEKRYETTGLDVDTLIQKSNQLYLKGDFEDALTLLLEAAGQEPNNVRVNNMLGSLYFKLGDPDTARRYWQNSLLLNGNQDEVRAFLDKLPAAATPAPEETP